MMGFWGSTADAASCAGRFGGGPRDGSVTVAACERRAVADLVAKMVFRFTTRMREIVRVLRGLPPDETVRQRTMAINAQLAKLREARLSQEKYREEAALQEVHMVVAQMAQLKESLAAAEQAAVEFVDQIGDQAKAQLEDEWNKKAETLMTTVVRTQEKFGADLSAVPQDWRSGTK